MGVNQRSLKEQHYQSTNSRTTMAKYLLTLALIGATMADDSGYAAPAPSYGAPAAASAYAAPATAYASPDAGYGAPDTGDGYAAEYDAPAGYGAVEEEAGFDLGGLTELLPLFLAVFAAIIVAQLFAPLLGVLFGAKVGLLGGLFAPLGNVKIDILNQILSPFNLVLAAFPVGGTAAAGPLTVAGTNGRSFASGFSANPETIDMVSNMLYSAIKNYSS